MSYDIYIGNAELESEWSADPEEIRAEWVVRGMTHPDAPFKPDLTGNGNSCHPGYSQWSNAMDEVGLSDVFFKQYEGLLSDHPGIKPLTPELLAEFEAARERYRRLRPDEKPGMCSCGNCDPLGHRDQERPPHDPTLNFNMLRLDWLCWWTRWALENCERPAMYNH